MLSQFLDNIMKLFVASQMRVSLRKMNIPRACCTFDEEFESERMELSSFFILAGLKRKGTRHV